MNTEESSVEIKRRISENQLVTSVYKNNFERIHKARWEELYNELTSMMKRNEKSEMIIQQVARLIAIDDISKDFLQFANNEKKLTKKLEEIENAERRKRESEIFQRNYGG